MKITKQQLADLVRGIGSVHFSPGDYEDDIAYVALGMVYQALADEILDGPIEDYEVPPVRTTVKDTPGVEEHDGETRTGRPSPA